MAILDFMLNIDPTSDWIIDRVAKYYTAAHVCFTLLDGLQIFFRTMSPDSYIVALRDRETGEFASCFFYADSYSEAIKVGLVKIREKCKLRVENDKHAANAYEVLGRVTTHVVTRSMPDYAEFEGRRRRFQTRQRV